eukprot:s4600_g2.t2
MMLSSRFLWLMVVKLAEGETPSTCGEGNETTGLLQLGKTSIAHLAVGRLEIVQGQGCCVVIDASNWSNPTLARTETAWTTDDCYSNATEAQDPAGYIRYFMRGCPDDLIENILKGMKAHAETAEVEEAAPGRPKRAEAASLALTRAESSSARSAASGKTVFENFEGTWPEPDSTRIRYFRPSRGTLRSPGARGTANCIVLVGGAIWLSPAFPVTSRVGTTLEAFLWMSSGRGIEFGEIGFDSSPDITGTKLLEVVRDCRDISTGCTCQLYFVDRANWGRKRDGGSARVPGLEEQWLQITIQVISTTEVVARLFDGSQNQRMTHKGDYSAINFNTISDSGTAWVALDPSVDKIAVDELASCNADFHEELPTDEGQCTSSQIPLNDTCVPGVNYTCSPAQLPVGTNQVSCESSDGYAYNFETEVKDTGPPLVSNNFSDVLEVATCGHSARVTFVGVEASDNCDTLTPTCTPASGSLFCLGTTDVTCTAQDLSGNNATPMTFQVTVGDTTPPLITQLADTHVTTCAETAQVAFEVEVSDNCDNVEPICAPASGSFFPVGTTNVTCTAQDSAGNAATPMTFHVTVAGDTTPPAFNATLENKTADAGCSDVAQVSFEAVATDGCGPSQVSCIPPSLSLFPVGSTRVQCVATDASGNAATENFDVTVTKGVEPPSFGPSSDVEVHSPYCRAMRVQFAVPSTGGCGAGAECFPASGSLFRLGKTQVTCTASNDAGSAETSFNVHVSCDAPPYRHRWRGRAGGT